MRKFRNGRASCAAAPVLPLSRKAIKTQKSVSLPGNCRDEGELQKLAPTADAQDNSKSKPWRNIAPIPSLLKNNSSSPSLAKLTYLYLCVLSG